MIEEHCREHKISLKTVTPRFVSVFLANQDIVFPTRLIGHVVDIINPPPPLSEQDFKRIQESFDSIHPR